MPFYSHEIANTGEPETPVQSQTLRTSIVGLHPFTQARGLQQEFGASSPFLKTVLVRQAINLILLRVKTHIKQNSKPTTHYHPPNGLLQATDWHKSMERTSVTWSSHLHIFLLVVLTATSAVAGGWPNLLNQAVFRPKALKSSYFFSAQYIA